MEEEAAAHTTDSNGTHCDEASSLNKEDAEFRSPSTPNSFEVKNLTQINYEDIIFVEKVGHGSYGVVHKAQLNGEFVAVKEFGPTADQKVIETEIKQLSRVSHEHIISLYGKSSNQKIEYLIMEYAEGGSLHNFLHGKVKPYYSFAHAISWARQCAEGVAYLHAMKPKPMIHRDLKPLNLLLTNKGRHLKICDFGTVADKSTLMTNNRGSAAWMAPEVFEGNNYTEKCDIFSWAIVLWEVLSRQIPFKEIDNPYSIMWKIHRGVRPPDIDKCPEPIQNLMKSCWTTKPEDRPSMQNVVIVLHSLADGLSGADEPLNYEYENQQIVQINSDDSAENYMSNLDFSSFNTIWHNTSNSNSLTPTNIPQVLNEILQTQKQMQLEPAITTTRWDVIPEESESCSTSVNPNASYTSEKANSFIFSPSPSMSKRYETIRKGMDENPPLPPLSVDVNENPFDLPDNSSSNDLDKNSDREKSTVSDSTSSRVESGLLSDDDSLTQLLDPDLQAEPPIPGNAESEAIYRQHQELGSVYLRVVTDLVYAQDFKEKILMQMDPVERQQKQELLKKMIEKEELLELYTNLKQQLEKLRSEDSQNSNRYVYRVQQNNNEPEQSTQPTDNVSEDGWVVVSSLQNS